MIPTYKTVPDPADWARRHWAAHTYVHTTGGLLGMGYSALGAAVAAIESWERSPRRGTDTVLGAEVIDVDGNILASWGEAVPDESPFGRLGQSLWDVRCRKCGAWTIDGGAYEPMPGGFGLCLDCTELPTTGVIRRIVPPGEKLPARTSKDRKRYRQGVNP